MGRVPWKGSRYEHTSLSTPCGCLLRGVCRGFCVGGRGDPDLGRQCAGQLILKDIQITNLTATCPKEAGIIIGLPESLVSNGTSSHLLRTYVIGDCHQQSVGVPGPAEKTRQTPLGLRIRRDHGHHGLLSAYQVAPDLGRGLLSEEEDGAEEEEAGLEVCSSGWDSEAQTAGEAAFA
jgi:hypothetical protein